MATLFELLFKYRPFIFEKGTVSMRPLWPWYASAALAILAVGGAFLLYRHTAGRLGNSYRIILAGLRATSLLVILAIFLQPVLILHSVIPQKNFVAILYDGTRSMEIQDGTGGRSRFALEQDLLSLETQSWLKDLGSKFKLRFFCFSDDVKRVQAFENPSSRGNITDLGSALNETAAELGSAPVAGIVLLTDGADNHSHNLSATAAQLRAKKLPVYPIGIGSPTISRDVEMVRVSAPRRVLKDTMVEAEVTAHATGYAGRTAKLQVKENGRTIHSQDVLLGGDGEVKSYEVSFNAGSEGVRSFEFQLEPFPEESIPQNNSTGVLVEVTDEKPGVLYVEGEPRWIYGFLRRAAADDKNLHLVTLLRQADGKMLRQGIDTPTDLEKGFPTQASELFSYKAIILGSIEASFFSFDQLRLISDFVSRRGGGFVMLGGKNSYGQGGYINTPLEDLLPVNIRFGQAKMQAPEFQDTEFKAKLTNYGLQHPIMKLSTTEAENTKRWGTAPELVGINPTSGPKPGAVVLASAAIPSPRSEPPVLLAFQRYGEGKSVALTTGSIWRWKMGLDHRDNLHDLFWKQLLRWLVNDVPDRVDVHPEKSFYSRDELASLRTEVRDESFFRVNNASVSAEIKSPSGKIRTLPLEWEVTRDGEYSGSFKPEEDGLYEINVETKKDGKSLGTGKTYLRVADSQLEFHNPELNTDLLKRLANETGGRFYTPDRINQLPEEMSISDTGSARLEERDLWDMPAFFLILAGTVLAEWTLRKRKGLL